MVKNDSEEEYTISSMMLFDVFFDGSEEESSISFMTIVAGGYTQLDGKIQPGETVTGTIAYTTTESWQSIEIRFWASYSAAERIVFSYQK